MPLAAKATDAIVDDWPVQTAAPIKALLGLRSSSIAEQLVAKVPAAAWTVITCVFRPWKRITVLSPGAATVAVVAAPFTCARTDVVVAEAGWASAEALTNAVARTSKAAIARRGCIELCTVSNLPPQVAGEA